MTDFPSKTVLYIPGFLSGNNSQAEMLCALRDVFPSCYNISTLPWEMKTTDAWHFPWETMDNDSFSDSWNKYLTKTAEAADACTSNDGTLSAESLNPLVLAPRWTQALESADTTAEFIAKSLLRLSEQERDNIILIGHSLGANIVIKTLYKINVNNAFIWKAILLGAAINNNDNIIRSACNGVKDKIISVINSADFALGIYSLVNAEGALGRGYKGLINRQKFQEISTDPIPEHASLFYLQQLRKKQALSN